MDIRPAIVPLGRLVKLYVGPLLLASWLSICGCAESSPVAPADTGASAAIGATSENAATEDLESLERELWEATYVQDSRAGYTYTTRQLIDRAEPPTFQIESVSKLSLRRFGELTEQVVSLSSLEDAEGRLLELRSETRMGPQALVIAARVEGDQLRIDSPGAHPRTIPWSPDVGGLMAVDDSLLTQPMEPGEKRTIRQVMPLLNEVVVVENRLHALDYEPTELLHGIYDLLKIESKMVMPGGQSIDSLIWTDRAGETLKTSMAAIGMETFRTSREIALDTSAPIEFDLGFESIVQIDKPLARPHDTSEIRYRVQLDHGDPAAVFVSGPTQQVRSVDANTAEITVRGVVVGDADSRFFAAPQQPPAEGDRAPNELIQSDDPVVIQLAEEAAGDESDPTQTALALERFVHQRIDEKNFSQAFATAAEVARSLEGDCTEHAVLLAALARARGIPARVAVGLVYIDAAHAFGYHMWNELFLDGRWIPLDATLGRGRVGAAHIKLADSNLSDSGAVSSFLPVVNVIGQLHIEVLDASYSDDLRAEQSTP